MEDLKVGDRVEIMNVWSRHMGQFGVVKKVNECDTVCNTYYRVLLDGEKEEMSFAKSELRKADSRTPKVGDRVVVISSTSEQCGMRAEVKHHSCTQHKSWLHFDSIGLHEWFDDADLAVVFEDDMSRKERKMQYKIGAKVKVTAKDALNFGKVGEVVACALQSEPALYKVKFGPDVAAVDRENVWYCEARLAPATIREFKESMSMFKVGDKVFVSCSVPEFNGKRGEVVEKSSFGNYYVSLQDGDTMWFDEKELSRYVGDSKAVATRRVSGSDVWHVNVAELADRTITGCKGLAFGEEE